MAPLISPHSSIFLRRPPALLSHVGGPATLTPACDLTGSTLGTTSPKSPPPTPIPAFLSPPHPSLPLPGNPLPNVPAVGLSNSHPPHHRRAPHPSSSSYTPTRSCSHPLHLSTIYPSSLRYPPTRSCSHPLHLSTTYPSSSRHPPTRSCSHPTHLSTLPTPGSSATVGHYHSTTAAL